MGDAGTRDLVGEAGFAQAAGLPEDAAGGAVEVLGNHGNAGILDGLDPQAVGVGDLATQGKRSAHGSGVL